MASATNLLTVVVTEVNSAPTLPILDPVTVAEGASINVTNTASDSDVPANVLSYQLVGAPAYASINGAGVITLSPSMSDGPATNTFATVVSDGTASATNSLTVIVTEESTPVGGFSITSIASSNGVAVITWSSEVGQFYQLQAKPILDTGSWTNAGTAIQATGTSTTTTDNLGTGAERYYRVKREDN